MPPGVSGGQVLKLPKSTKSAAASGATAAAFNGASGARSGAVDSDGRCVLVSQPGTGTLMARCTYLIDPSVPEAWVSAVRSGVLVKLREALLVHGEVEEAEEEVKAEEEEEEGLEKEEDALQGVPELWWIERVEKELDRDDANGKAGDPLGGGYTMGRPADEEVWAVTAVGLSVCKPFCV